MTVRQHAILVGVGDAASSDAAVRWAAEEATARHRPLRILHVYQWQPVVPGSPLYSMAWGTHEPPEIRQRASEIITHATAFARVVSPTLDIDSEVLEGERAVVLSAEARNSAMLVLGSRFRHTSAGVKYRPVRTLPARLTVPMIIARPSFRPRSQPVVVAVEHDALAHPLLAFAVDYAARHQAPIQVLVRDRRHDSASPKSASATWLDEVKDSCRTAGLDTLEHATLVTRDHTETLLSAADRASIIVTAQRPQRPAPGRHFPPLATLLLRRATCPLALVPTGRQALPVGRLLSFLRDGDQAGGPRR